MKQENEILKKEIEEKAKNIRLQLEKVNNEQRMLYEELLRLEGEYRLIIKLENDNKNAKTEPNNIESVPKV